MEGGARRYTEKEQGYGPEMMLCMGWGKMVYWAGWCRPPGGGAKLKEPLSWEYPKEKDALYGLLALQAQGLLEGERDPVANMANVSALLGLALEWINWAGFYLLRGEELVLGPFQGKPACVRIPVGKGVCGTAAATGQTQLVPDVHAFPGHIACDEASRSEIVVPLLAGGKLVGVLDIDSPILARFDQQDRQGLQELAGLLAEGCDWP